MLPSKVKVGFIVWCVYLAGVQGSEAIAGQELRQEVSDTWDWLAHTNVCFVPTQSSVRHADRAACHLMQHAQRAVSARAGANDVYCCVCGRAAAV
jgi:hypothetical protein